MNNNNSKILAEASVVRGGGGGGRCGGCEGVLMGSGSGGCVKYKYMHSGNAHFLNIILCQATCKGLHNLVATMI